MQLQRIPRVNLAKKVKEITRAYTAIYSKATKDLRGKNSETEHH